MEKGRAFQRIFCAGASLWTGVEETGWRESPLFIFIFFMLLEILSFDFVEARKDLVPFFHLSIFKG